MSYYRIHRAVTKSFLKSPNTTAFYRLQSNSAGTVRKRSVLRTAIYGLTFTSVSVAGGVIAYANYDPQFKVTLDGYLPGFADFTDRSVVLWNKGIEITGSGWNILKKIVLPEKSERVGLQIKQNVETVEKSKPSSEATTPPPEIVIATPSETTPPPEIVIATPSETTPPPEIAVTTPQSVSAPPETKPEEIVAATPPETTPSPEIATPSSEVPATTPSETTPSPEIATPSSEVPTTTPLEVTPSELSSVSTATADELNKVFQEFTDVSQIAVESLNELAQAIDTHHMQLLTARDSPAGNKNEIDIVVESITGTGEAVNEARVKVESAKDRQHQVSQLLTDAVSAAKKEGLSELVEQVCEKVSECTAALEQSEDKVKEAKKKWESIWNKPESAVQEQMVGENQENLTEKELAVMKEEERKIVEEVLMKQQQEMDEIIKEKLSLALQEKEKQFQEDIAKLEAELQHRYEQKIKDQLHSQAEANSYFLKQALREQAERITRQLESEHAQDRTEAEEAHQKKMAVAYAHLKGIHSMIDNVVEASDRARRQQSVKVASDALVNALVSANNDPDPYTKHSIAQEVSTLLEVAREDQFISTVLSAIPKEALDRGISSETGLKNRFEQVKRVSRRVALVPEEGGGLGTYLLSFIQSLLTIDMIHPQMADLTRVDPKSMSTFALLRQAKLSLDSGDLETAVRVVSQLKGESRKVAHDWLCEAVLYLEIRQAVMAVTWYLAAVNAAVLQ